jgi:predicted GNAT family N-acyltransferase
MIDCRVVVDEDEFAQCAAIRLEVFVDEQRVPADEELDDLDAISVHVLARVDGGPVGTGRLIPTDDGRGKIGRMAVRKPFRGSGVGAAIMDQLLDVARERGMHGLTLSAQLHALGFYERFGFVAHGDVFLEAGIEHREMARSLA